MKQVDFDDKLTFSEHLEEFRSRLIYIALAVFAGCGISYTGKDILMSLLQRPLPEQYKSLTFLAPAEAFIMVFKISFFAGIIFALPVIFYQLWSFACPAFLKQEKRYAALTIAASTIFFFIGIVFAYTVVLPLGLDFLLTYGEQFGTPSITISHYLSFTIKFIVSFGIIFELPVAVALLSRVGIINSETLSKNRGVSIIMIFVVSALLTPPDVVSQILMSGPLLILFEISIYVAKLFGKKNQVEEE